MRLCAFADEASKSLDGQIAALSRNGVSLIELRGVNGKNISELSPAEIKEASKRLADAGISVWSFGSPIGKIRVDEDFAPHFDKYLRLCEAAVAVNCSHMRIFSFYPDKNGEHHRDESFERLSRMIDTAPTELVLCHENEKGIYGDTDLTCLDILTALPRLRAIFDPANFVQCGVETRAAWERLASYTEYLHIKDALADGTVVPAGRGLGNVEYIIGSYLTLGGDVISCEPHLQHFSGLDALENGERTKLSESSMSTDEAFDLGVSSTKSIIRKFI